MLGKKDKVRQISSAHHGSSHCMATRKKKSVGEVQTGPDGLWITVRAIGRAHGVASIDFTFLRSWIGPRGQAAFVDAIVKLSRRYVAAQNTYSVRCVLQFWQALGARRGWSAPSRRMSSAALVAQLSDLRGEFYAARAAVGVALTTITNQWTSFVRFIPCLVQTGAINFVESKLAAISAPPRALIIADREHAANSPVCLNNAPKTLNSAQNSYNDNLFESISIVDGSAEYLDRYQEKLGKAVNTILRCAVKDFEEFVAQRERGLAEISRFDVGSLHELKAHRRGGFSRENWGHLLNQERYEKGLRIALGICVFDMGGIPRQRRKFDVKSSKASILDGSSRIWDFVSSFGKNELLPYLGIMSSKQAAVCILILLIEHPILNPVALYRARIERDRHGGTYISSDGLVGKGGIRFSVEKLRAGEEKSVELSPLAQRVLVKVFEWTEPVRTRMIQEGRRKDANHLWIGISSLDYRLKAFSEKAFLNALGASEAWRSVRGAGMVTRATNFGERHAELAPWREKLTYKNLRMNSGVLKFLEADGDLVVAARIFGHRSVKTTLGHYVPNALRIALFERQVRRHQNRLIVQAFSDHERLLEVSDFSTVEDLHLFLSGSADEAAEAQVPRRVYKAASPGAGLILCKDPDALAVAMLYRDRLESASATFLDRPDLRTGVAPRFWRDFVDTLTAPLPPALIEITDLVECALARKTVIISRIRLPEIR